MTVSKRQQIDMKRGAYKRKRKKKINRMKASGHTFSHGTGKKTIRTRERINILPLQVAKERSKKTSEVKLTLWQRIVAFFMRKSKK